MGMVAILVIRPASCHQIFISLYLKAFMQSLVQIGTVVSEKIQFEFLYVRGAIQNYVDFFYNFKTENQPHMKLGIHII